MSTRIAYVGVIIIWSTTPLAINWSSEGVGFIFAVTLRMSLGMIASWVMLRVMRQSLPLHTRALCTYVVSGLSIYLSMCCIYWASQYIPSGWISVVFGLSPILTGILAMLILGEDALSMHKILGMVMGVIGLTIIFGNSYHFGYEFILGIAALLMGTVIHSLSSVVIKNIHARLSGIAATTGGLVIATPLFIATWFIIDGNLPDSISIRALCAILYLGLVATTVGLSMYYFILTRMEVSRVSLITLITPVCALLLGYALNSEPVTLGILLGTGFILVGLLFHVYGRGIISYVLRSK